MFNAFPYYGLTNNITLKFDRRFHDSYLMKCLHNNDYPKWYNTMTTIIHLVSNVKTTSNQCNA